MDLPLVTAYLKHLFVLAISTYEFVWTSRFFEQLSDAFIAIKIYLYIGSGFSRDQF